MSDAIESFMIEVGWLPNTNSQAKVEAAAKATEDKITAENARALEQRQAQVDAARQRRIASELAAGRQISDTDKQFVEEAEKRRRAAADDGHKREIEGAKRSSAVRSEQFKQAEANILRFASVAQTVASGVTGALSAAPFGSFLLGVNRTAGAMSNLAVQSQRVGATAAGIQRYLFAMKQAGVEEGEANAALEGFSKTIKTNPKGYKALLESWGVATKDAEGNDLSLDQVLANLGRARLSKEPLQQATIEANRLGISGDNAINALRDPGALRQGYGAYDAKLHAFGLDPDKAAEDARKVQRAYDNLDADLKIARTRMEADFFVPMMGAFDGMAKWVEAHPNELKEFQNGLLTLAGVVSVRVIPQLVKLTMTLTGLSGMKPAPWLLALLGIEGAKYLAGNTMSNVDPWADQSAGETAMRAADPGLADRVYGKRGEQLPHGPHHGLGTHAQPHDDRNLWQRTMPKAVGGKDAPEGAPPRESATDRLRRAARGPGTRIGRGADSDTGPQSDANAPGASGYGLTDAPYRANVDRKGEGGHLSPRELFDYLKSRGATDNEATMLTSAAGSESSFNPNANHDPAYPGGPPTGHGLWGHKHSRIDMRGMTWQQQADAALSESRDKRYAGRIAAARTPQELTDAQMYYEGPRGFRPGNPRAGDNYTGRLHTTDRFSKAFGTLGQSPHAQTPAPAPAPGAPIIGDQAALDAQNRIVAGRGTSADHALIEAHRRQQNAPAPVPSDRNPDGTIKLADRTLGRYIHVTKPMAAKGEMPHPHVIGPYDGTEHLGLDAAHQKLADAMKGGASGQPIKVEVAKPVPGFADLHKNMASFFKEHTDSVTGKLRLFPHALPPGHSSVHHGDRTHNERHGDSFHIHTSDAKAGLDHAVRVSARRGSEDRVRNGQG